MIVGVVVAIAVVVWVMIMTIGLSRLSKNREKEVSIVAICTPFPLPFYREYRQVGLGNSEYIPASNPSLLDQNANHWLNILDQKTNADGIYRL